MGFCILSTVTIVGTDFGVLEFKIQSVWMIKTHSDKVIDGLENWLKEGVQNCTRVFYQLNTDAQVYKRSLIQVNVTTKLSLYFHAPVNVETCFPLHIGRLIPPTNMLEL